MNPSERSARARIAALNLHSQRDPQQTTKPAREAYLSSFERAIDPQRVLPPEERARRAKRALRAHMIELALRSAAVRRRRAGK